MAQTQKDQPAGKLTLEVLGGVGRITISNPGRYNAMSLAMWRQLAQLARQAEQDPAVRVLMLQGDGDRAFVSGADISEFDSLRSSTEQVRAYGIAVDHAQEALSRCAKPVVAAIRGVCMGGGIGLALACDLRYCTDDSRFRMPAAKLGLGYDRAGIRRAVQMLGAARTAEMFFTARDFNGTEAERIGMVHQSFPGAVFADEIAALAGAIAANAPLTIRAAKLAIRHAVGDPAAQDETAVDQAVQDCFDSKDYQEGRLAFQSRRPPRFSGT
ncbi:enoyl-CoA hydratase [Parapusillimonas granuli]|uniref:Enoyl-CoA hydratase/isomerase family protein n=1 Tax=Parapusillimonas granuli TaxID=380911 RepID=A0A853FYT3_9BURK|nr:enoyl-CoA hydratase [Parapusillimonas granuli]MBB5214935.1 enoyl-CoA hydratase/carnithine racemase [Parapusillimonas granuli]NYT49257.1 enoyl-CoA hydratase/isomerase family protein [Parapusillimonas granuli]